MERDAREGLMEREGEQAAGTGEEREAAVQMFDLCEEI